MTISSKFRRIFLGDSKHKGEPGASIQADDRSAAASSGQVDDGSAAARSQFYALLIGGEDERERQQLKLVDNPATRPWSAICHVKCTFSDEGEKSAGNGTGFLISDTVVVTAAHNLCRLKKNGKKTGPDLITVTLAGNAGRHDTTHFTYDPRYADFLEQLFENNNDQLSREELGGLKKRFSASEDPAYYDYGAIFLDKPLEPKPNFVFKLRGTDPRDALWDKPLGCAGYPAQHGHQLYCAEGSAHPSESDRFLGDRDYLAVHNVFASGGESGGPLYVSDGDGEFVAIGIFVRSNEGEEITDDVTVRTNGAVRITNEMEVQIKRWEEENKRRTNQRGPQDLIA